MTFDAAVITEKGVTFVIIIVKPEVLKHDFTINEARKIFSKFFPTMPIVLMAQESATTPTYQGRQDLVKFLNTVDFMLLPWKTYTVKEG
ncbi:MAG: hypothetical protein PHP26_02890 [Syntrophomonas sp.]|uniref:hypothetical protein n=1 Tax=Syntrophomonas sp. TaxID=2053627 RepID=UPI002626A3D3|nr:hypothetical protein [Syntrophomonas sp.]MDD2510150.1 hypothetical protein [Syntrophomonas sp.]MDD3878922.1 hypothetical protein [Syntrophomonas sp.]MDD4625981.1 hypothetical protein [Syntrophomonas sp.]